MALTEGVCMKSLTEIKDKAMLEKLASFDICTADDKILIVLIEMGLEKEYTPFEEVDLHRAVYKTKQIQNKLFEEFSFRTTSTYPYSALLERVLMRLKISRVLSFEDFEYSKAKLSDGTTEYATREIIPKLACEDYEALRLIGKQLVQTV